MPRARVSLLLAAAGIAMIAAALLRDRMTGQPLTIGWSQLFLLLLGGVALVASPPPVQRQLHELLVRSRAESAAIREMLGRRPGLYLIYSLWFVLAISLGEIGLRTYERLSHKRVLGLQYLWSAPLGYVVPLAGAGLVCLLAARRTSRRLLLPTLVFLCVFVALLGWLVLTIQGLHVGAAAVLGAGMAAQVARITTRHAYILHLTVRRTFLALATLVIVLAAGAFAWPRWTEYRTLAQLAPARSSAPDVLLIVLDTVRAKSLSLYGYSRSTTPNLDRFAARGLVFERALSTSPWTLPSHGSMFTGRFPHEQSGAWLTPIDATHRTLAEAMTQHGYLTAGFVANTIYCPAEFGLGRGFAHYEDRRVSPAGVLRGTTAGGVFASTLFLPDQSGSDQKVGFKSADSVNRDFLRWLAQRDENRPYFAFLNYYDAHAPYLSPPEFATRFSAKRPRGDIWSKKLDAWTPAEIPEFNDAYDGIIGYLDHQLGVLFDELQRRGALENTVVVITSDHGEQFGEHGLLEHANSLYLPLLHVPLVIIYPSRVPAERRAGALVSLRDLPATILDLAGLTDAVGFPGQSLGRYWQDPAGGPQRAGDMLLAEVDQVYDAYPNTYPARKGRMRSIILNDMHYIKNYGDGREELYDLVRDFEEKRNLADREPRVLEQFRAYVQLMLDDARTRSR